MPDGRSYFWVAKATAPEGRGYLGQHKCFAIGLGCDLAYADRLVYSTGVVLDDPTTAVPIGAGCKICNREACTQRAFPYRGPRGGGRECRQQLALFIHRSIGLNCP